MHNNQYILNNIE